MKKVLILARTSPYSTVLPGEAFLAGIALKSMDMDVKLVLAAVVLLQHHVSRGKALLDVAARVPIDPTLLVALVAQLRGALCERITFVRDVR